MRKLFVLMLCTLLVRSIAIGQDHYQLNGKVVDIHNEPLTGASIYIPLLRKGAVSDVEGHYRIGGLAAGTYVLEVSFVGYQTVTDTLLMQGDMSYNAKLKRASLSLQEVVIKDDYARKRKEEEALSVEIVNEAYLKQNLGGSLMGSLERLPGVSTIDIGSGQGKPVIRGLSFNRVVVVENSIKHEAQQWGTDHGLEIDQYAVDQVEIIKGPASLMFGSDALGGVIHLNNKNLPLPESYGGVLDLTGKSNNALLGSSLMLYGRKKRFYADIRLTWLDYGDYKVPTDSIDIYSYRAALYRNHLRNTAGQEQNIHLSFGYFHKAYQARLYLSRVSSKNGFFANAHGLEPRNVDTEVHDASNRDIQYPYQSVHHLKLIQTNQYQWKALKFELDFGIQRNTRHEWSSYVSHGYMPALFPDTLSFNPNLEREFDKYVYSGSFKAHTKLKERTRLSIGFNSEYQDNRIDGRGFIIPAFKQLNMGAFVLASHSVSSKSKLLIGLRYDIGKVSTTAYNDWFLSPVMYQGDTSWHYLQRAEALDRSFSNLSWSVGYTYHPGRWSYKANLGKSFRMPIAKELAANGVNYHRFSYEVGQADLSPEVAYQLDLGLEYARERFAIGATPFVSYFPNYIYLNPSAEHNRLYGNGNQVFYYTQSQVLRYGAELHSHFEVNKHVQLGLIGEYVYSEQLSGDKKGFTLPFSPPASAILNAKYTRPKLAFVEQAYASVDYRLTASQNNIVPPEVSTEGYQLVNLAIGGNVKWRKQSLDISFQVRNLLNTKYFNHTSFYRLINVPEAGRNYVLNISFPFSGNFKNRN